MKARVLAKQPLCLLAMTHLNMEIPKQYQDCKLQMRETKIHPARLE